MISNNSPTILRINLFNEEETIRQIFEAHKSYAAGKYKTETVRRLYKALYTLSFESAVDFALDTINILESLDKALYEKNYYSVFILFRKLFEKVKEDFFFKYEKVREIQDLIKEEDVACLDTLSQIVEEKIEKVKEKNVVTINKEE